MIFKIFSLLILILFYGIYFTKMYVQKKKGIQTRQIGKCKNKDIRIVEMLMSIATFVIVPVQIISIIIDLKIFNDGIRYVGILVGIIGDILFLIAVVTMKDSWRAGIPNEDKTTFIFSSVFSLPNNSLILLKILFMLYIIKKIISFSLKIFNNSSSYSP